MSDTSLRQDVTDALEFEPSLDAAQIGVAVEDGVVTLTGHVTTYAEKVKAEEIAGRVKGVRGLAQEIEVRPPAISLADDGEIARRIVDALAWSTKIPQDVLKVSVTRGWVTLTGTVEWNYQREEALRIVHALSGVVGINNQITLTPKATQADVHSRIEKALKREAQIEASGIKVSVADGTVRLEGKVHSWRERDLVEQAAWAAPGVQQVTDRLTVA